MSKSFKKLFAKAGKALDEVIEEVGKTIDSVTEDGPAYYKENITGPITDVMSDLQKAAEDFARDIEKEFEEETSEKLNIAVPVNLKKKDLSVKIFKKENKIVIYKSTKLAHQGAVIDMRVSGNVPLFEARYPESADISKSRVTFGEDGIVRVETPFKENYKKEDNHTVYIYAMN